MFDCYSLYSLYSAFCPICKINSVSANVVSGEAECFICQYRPLSDCMNCNSKKTLVPEGIQNRSRKCKKCGQLYDSSDLIIDQKFDLYSM